MADMDLRSRVAHAHFFDGGHDRNEFFSHFDLVRVVPGWFILRQWRWPLECRDRYARGRMVHVQQSQ